MSMVIKGTAKEMVKGNEQYFTPRTNDKGETLEGFNYEFALAYDSEQMLNKLSEGASIPAKVREFAEKGADLAIRGFARPLFEQGISPEEINTRATEKDWVNSVSGKKISPEEKYVRDYASSKFGGKTTDTYKAFMEKAKAAGMLTVAKRLGYKPVSYKDVSEDALFA